jgi:hypothetical protein
MRLATQLALILLLVLHCSACSGSRSATDPGRDSAFVAQQLAELETLPCPTGCDQALWGELKLALRLALLDQPRTVAKAPQGARARAVLRPGFLEDTVDGWYYVNPGDYNQDGLVSVSDLTPLGANFLVAAEDGSFDFASALSVVDGDGNGIINISDLTPLGGNLGVRVESYNAYASDTAGDVPEDAAASTLTPLASVPFSAATGNKVTDRLFFAWPTEDAVPFDYVWVRPYDDADEVEGARSNVLGERLSVALVDPPDVGTGNFGDAYVLGNDADYELRAELQFRGDVTHDHGLEFRLTPSDAAEIAAGVLHVGSGNANFSLSANYNDYPGDPNSVMSDNVIYLRKGTPDEVPVPALTVTPDSGPRGFSATLDASGTTDDGTITDYMWDRNGDGVFEYNSGTNPTIEIAVAGSGSTTLAVTVMDDAGHAATTSQTVTVEGQWHYRPVDNLSEFNNPSLTIIGGNPAIAYTDDSADRLKFSRSLDATGEIWSVPIIPDPLNASGFQPTLVELTGGNPAVIYQGQPPANVAGFISAADGAGTVWNPAVTFSFATNGISGAVITDSPALAYNNKDDSKLYFQRATSLDGSSWNDPPVLVDPNAIVDGPPSLVEFDTRPVITYKDTVTGAFMYCQSMDSGGSSFLEPVVAIADVGNAIYSDLLVLGGRPSFSSNYGFAAHFTRANDEFGGAWNTPVNIGPGFMPLKPAVAQMDGIPIAAYCTPNDDQMIFAMAVDAEGTTWQSEVLDPSRDAGPDCAMVNGNPAVAYIGPFGELLYAVFY